MLLILLLLCVSSSAYPSWRSCVYCQKVVTDCYAHYGNQTDNMTTIDLINYFGEVCPHYMLISPVLSEICKQMSNEKSRIVFPALKKMLFDKFICTTCDYCTV